MSLPRTALTAAYWGFVLYLFLPLTLLMAMSFMDANFIAFPLGDLTRPAGDLFNARGVVAPFQEPLLGSLQLGTVLAIALGVIALGFEPVQASPTASSATFGSFSMNSFSSMIPPS